jgi:hypothetical protein
VIQDQRSTRFPVKRCNSSLSLRYNVRCLLYPRAAFRKRDDRGFHPFLVVDDTRLLDHDMSFVFVPRQEVQLYCLDRNAAAGSPIVHAQHNQEMQSCMRHSKLMPSGTASSERPRTRTPADVFCRCISSNITTSGQHVSCTVVR